MKKKNSKYILLKQRVSNVCLILKDVLDFKKQKEIIVLPVL